MSTDKLNKALDASLDSFVKEINCRFPENDVRTVTTDDLRDLSKQFVYTLDDFRKIITKYIK